MRSGHYDDYEEREERERLKYNVFVRMIQGLSKSGGAVHCMVSNLENSRFVSSGTILAFHFYTTTSKEEC